MSLPDFKDKNILFVFGSDISDDKLQFKNDNICLTKDGKIVNQLSCHKVFAVFVLGNCSLTSVLIRNCERYGVSLFLLKENFELYAKIVSIAEGNYLLRMKQYNFNDDFGTAKNLVSNKLQNQITLLQDLGKTETVQFIEAIQGKINQASGNKELLGIEGSSSKLFFENYFGSMGWLRRAPRTKFDITNTLMDIGYTLLFNFIDALLGLYGFDAYKGFYHKLFFQRKSLACDLCEPFRCLIDKQILKSHNLKQINEKDFKVLNGRYELVYGKQKRYLEIFAENIMNYKEYIFCYIRDFYYYVINRAPFPKFTLE